MSRIRGTEGRAPRSATILLAALLAVPAGCARKEAPAPVVLATAPSPPQARLSPAANPRAPADRPNVVVVQKGETLYSIARRHDVPIRTVIEANNLEPPYYVVVGQSLKIPQVKQYIVQPGDTLNSVSRKFGVDASTLAATNKISAPYVLKTGLALILPAVVQAPPQMASKPPANPVPPQVSTAAGASAPAAQPQRPVRQAVQTPAPATAEEPARPEKESEKANREKDGKPGRTPPKPAPPQPADAPPVPAPAPAAASGHVLALRTEEPRVAMATPPQQPAPQAATKSQAPVPPPGPAPASPPVPAPREAAKDSEEAEETAEPAPAPHSAAGFQWPVRGPVLTGFGPGPGGMQNDGINLAAALGTPVAAANDGEVAYVGNELRGYGNLVLLKHPDGWMTAYAHLDGITVKPHEHVRRGEVIAHVGHTGAVAEPQLHFEMRRGTRALDPANYLPSLSAAR